MPALSRMHPASRAVLLAFTLLVLGLLFQELVTLLVAVLVTVLISIPLSAAATRLERRRIPRTVGVVLALLTGIALLCGLLTLIVPPLGEQTENFIDQVPAMVDSLEESIGGLLDAEPSEVGDSIQETLEGYTDDPGSLVGPLASIGLSLVGAIGALLVILITAAYIAINPEPLVDSALGMLPPDRREWARGVLERLRKAWVGWMQGVGIDMLITGVLLYLGLTLIGLDFAMVFAVLSAVLVVIPYFGAIAAGIPPVLFALADSPEKALLTLGVYVLVQQIESNVTIPLVMSERVQLHPAVVAIGVVVVGQLFGFAGLFVAVPILSLIVIAVDELWVRPLQRSGEIIDDSPESEPGPAPA
jgi:predicted PurR-regulated permease PerM